MQYIHIPPIPGSLQKHTACLQWLAEKMRQESCFPTNIAYHKYSRVAPLTPDWKTLQEFLLQYEVHLVLPPVAYISEEEKTDKEAIERAVLKALCTFYGTEPVTSLRALYQHVIDTPATGLQAAICDYPTTEALLCRTFIASEHALTYWMQYMHVITTPSESRTEDSPTLQ